MDYETLVRCYFSMKRNDRYARDASEIMIKEITDTKDISREDRLVLLHHIDDWKYANEEEKAEIISKIYEIFMNKEQFVEKWTEGMTHCLMGGKIEDF